MPAAQAPTDAVVDVAGATEVVVLTGAAVVLALAATGELAGGAAAADVEPPVPAHSTPLGHRVTV